jgi:hypothetical protein
MLAPPLSAIVIATWYKTLLLAHYLGERTRKRKPPGGFYSVLYGIWRRSGPLHDVVCSILTGAIIAATDYSMFVYVCVCC